MQVQFECWDIATAPKDRKLCLFVPGRGWVPGKWDDQKYHRKPQPYWAYPHFSVYEQRQTPPTHWAELSDMIPKEPRP